MLKRNRWIFFGLSLMLVLLVVQSRTPGQYDDFANCLSEKNAEIYGSDRCINCQEQKSLFGKSFKNLNYINCDFSRETCVNELIYGLPTWKINEKMLVGTQSLEILAFETGCELT